MKDIFSNIEQQIENIDAKIEDIVKNATNANHYEKLNQKINEMVNSSAHAFERGYTQAETVVKEQIDKVKTPDVTQKENIEKYKEQESSVSLRHLVAQKDGYHGGGLAMAIIGYILVVLVGFGILTMSILNIAMPFVNVFAEINRYVLGPSFLVFLLMGIAGSVMMARVKRFKKYVQILAGKRTAKVKDLALVVGKTEAYTAKDLQKMVQSNWFKQGSLSRDKETFMLDKATYDLYEANENHLMAQARMKEANAQRQASLPQDARFVISKGEDFLKIIHEKKVAISDYDMTIKLTHLETILKKIFKRVETHPEVVVHLRKTIDYYLPTTVKLLDAYGQLDKQAIGGANITAAKAEIEASLDTLITAYEKLLDDLFEDVMLDVSTDISVLNTMLAQDGLAGSDFENLQ